MAKAKRSAASIAAAMMAGARAKAAPPAQNAPATSVRVPAKAVPAAAAKAVQAPKAPAVAKAVRAPKAAAVAKAPKAAAGAKAVQAPKAVAGAESGALGSVLAAIERRDFLAALEALLAAWRAHPAKELATAIESLGRLVDRAQPRLAGTDDELHAAWLALAAGRRSLDVGRLMERLEEGTLAQLAKRFEILGGFARDPRIAIPALQIPLAYTSYGAEPAYTAAFTLAAKMGDGRAIAVLDKQIADGYLREVSRESKTTSEYRQRLVRKAEKAKAALALPPKLAGNDGPVVERMFAAIDAAVPPKPGEIVARTSITADRGAQLLAAVLEAPDDDAPRAVWADWLLERGDERGELISLQLAGTDNKRVAELLKAHANDWIRPLDSVVRADTIRFARGFLVSCVIEKLTTRDVIGHPLWATVRELGCGDQELLLHPVMRSLRRATFDAEGLAQLARRPAPVPLEAMMGPYVVAAGQRMWDGIDLRDRGAWERALGTVGALTHLHTASIRAQPIAELTWFFTTKLAAQLRTLELVSRWWGADVAGALGAAERMPALERLFVRQVMTNPLRSGTGGHALFVFERARGGWAATVQINSASDVVVDRVISNLANVAPKQLRSLALEYTGSTRVDAAQLAALAAQLDRFGEIAIAPGRSPARNTGDVSS